MPNQMRLEIYNRRLETTRIEQKQAVTLEQAVGNAGGLLGLWLGASMMTVLEICELLANICSCIWWDKEETQSSTTELSEEEVKQRSFHGVV